MKQLMKLNFVNVPQLITYDYFNPPFLDDSQQATLPNLGAQKKNSSRRNAWGNLSYADLITQAINSAVDNRLTLSQIYEWMVQNVPYFKDKGDSNSSAGWKVNILPNFSRVLKIQINVKTFIGDFLRTRTFGTF